MVLSSWFRRRNKDPTAHTKQQQQDQLYGITHQLIDHVRSFTMDTFKNFPVQDEEAAISGDSSVLGNVQHDLSDWQEQHALLVLSQIKELAQLRFKLCPGYLKEREFWRIYFILVWNDVAEYELQAIRLAKIKKMAMGNEESSNSSGYEVEMSETKQAASPEPPTS
ncbi:uncharacterized protein LOC126657319 [Mercurialis annua]|uniref:uncharacterized protein LOC126657319 n=1 Tax=Mercurialis annua TaxID=3986 RepID=UPI00215DFBB5|nr:uncharacterized protein LOC126657319 [Mercurialis annua]